jgi:hypothetical protein
MLIHLPTREQMLAKIATDIAADRELAPAARKAREDALRERIAAAIEAARMPYAGGNAPRLVVGTPASWEPGDNDGLVEPAPQAASRPFQGTYKRARDLAGTVFPVSEAVILAAARKASIGRKFGRVILFSPGDVHQLYEVMPCPSGSSAAPNRPIGSYAAPSGASALKKLRARLTAASPRKSGRSARPKSSNSPCTVVELRQPGQKPR